MTERQHAALCDAAGRLHADHVWRAAQLQQAVGSAFGALAIAFFLFSVSRMPQLFRRVSQVLMRWMLVFILIHNVCMISITVWHQLLRSRQQTSCDLLVVTWKCLLLRVPTIACVIGMTVVYMLMAMDALLYAFATRDYERWAASARAPAAIFVCLLLFIGIPTAIIYAGELLDQPRIYCTPSTERVNPRLTALYLTLFAADALGTLCFCFLIRRLFRQLKRNKHEFVVERKVEMRTSIASMRFLLASTFLRCVFVWPFLFGTALIRIFLPLSESTKFFEWIAWLYIIQWYGGALACLLYYWRPFRLTNARIANFDVSEERKIHFENLRTMWK